MTLQTDTCIHLLRDFSHKVQSESCAFGTVVSTVKHVPYLLLLILWDAESIVGNLKHPLFSRIGSNRHLAVGVAEVNRILNQLPQGGFK